MQSLDPLFARLSRSKFRSRFRLGMKERQYCLEKGAPVIEQHAADFVAKRLAPALPANDGKQTPMRGHPRSVRRSPFRKCSPHVSVLPRWRYAQLWFLLAWQRSIC
ncbi:DUF4186 family protein [Shigella flexneri]